MTNFRRILGIVLGLCFVIFAVVQFNDPDTLVWIAIYLSAAVLSFAAAFGKANTAVLAIACLAYAAGAIYWWPEHFEGVSDSMRDAATGRLIPNIEEGRESLGLIMCSITMLVLLLVSKYGRQNRPTDNV